MDSQDQYLLEPGSIYTSQENVWVRTVLGSSVSVCIWDRQRGYGGINHFNYPHSGNNARTAQYGEVSIRYLIKMMLEWGSQLADLQVHLIGGSENPEMNSAIGKENVAIAEEILLKQQIEITTKDVGGPIGRKVIYNTGSGEMIVYKCMQLRESDWY